MGQFSLLWRNIFCLAQALAMWDTCLCRTVFLGTVKYILLCTSPGDVEHLAMWDSWVGPLTVPLIQVRLYFVFLFFNPFFVVPSYLKTSKRSQDQSDHRSKNKSNRNEAEKLRGHRGTRIFQKISHPPPETTGILIGVDALWMRQNVLKKKAWEESRPTILLYFINHCSN